MNLRFISKRVQDSNQEVLDTITSTQSTLDDMGVDYETQAIGESDVEYLAYLKDMVPHMEDSSFRAAKADSFSKIVPMLDFQVDLSDETKQVNGDSDSRGGWFTFEDENDDFTKVITAGDFLVYLFGAATIRLDVEFELSPGSYDTPSDESSEITSSDLTLNEIFGIWVLKGGEPVVYIEGSIAAEDLDFMGAPVVDSFSNYVLLENPIVSKGTLEEVDSILNKTIGSVEYSADTEN